VHATGASSIGQLYTQIPVSIMVSPIMCVVSEVGLDITGTESSHRRIGVCSKIVEGIGAKDPK